MAKHAGFLSSLLLFSTLLIQPSEAQDREHRSSEIRVLYVGPNPDPASADHIRPIQSPPERFPERKRELALGRPKDFENLLREHFTTVKIMTSVDYEPEDSDAYDVTIFDEVPGFIEGQVRQVHLPRDFSKASIMIGAAAPEILQQSGFRSKLDHL